MSDFTAGLQAIPAWVPGALVGLAFIRILGGLFRVGR